MTTDDDTGASRSWQMFGITNSTSVDTDNYNLTASSRIAEPHAVPHTDVGYSPKLSKLLSKLPIKIVLRGYDVTRNLWSEDVAIKLSKMPPPTALCRFFFVARRFASPNPLVFFLFTLYGKTQAISISTNPKVQKSLVMSILLNGCESWTLRIWTDVTKPSKTYDA